jgi:hypothetical protein
METLARYANPPFNYLGTTLFLSYILLALYFTFSISRSLYGQYKRIPALKLAEGVKDARTRHIKIYAFLASISFAILSYNMLKFLIQSLTVWARTQNLLGRRLSLLDLRFWMLETNLFGTFAAELVSKRPSAFWTQAALLGTWFWNVWMACKGKLACISRAARRILIPCSPAAQILATHDGSVHRAEPDPPYHFHGLPLHHSATPRCSGSITWPTDESLES